MANYPSLKWIRSWLRWGYVSSIRDRVLSAYIIGSEAKGTARQDSDLDIAAIIPPRGRVSAIQRTERYHQKFTSNLQKPTWNGRVVDFQFFYPDDAELSGYSKIKLGDR